MKLLYKMVHHNKYTKNHRKHSSNKGTQRARYMKKGGATPMDESSSDTSPEVKSVPNQEDSGSVLSGVTDAIKGVGQTIGDSFKQFTDNATKKSDNSSPMDISPTESSIPSEDSVASPPPIATVTPTITTEEIDVDKEEKELDNQTSDLQAQITNLEAKISELEDKNSELTDQLTDYEELKNIFKKMMGSSTVDKDFDDEAPNEDLFNDSIQNNEPEDMNEMEEPKSSLFDPTAQEEMTSPPMSPREGDMDISSEE